MKRRFFRRFWRSVGRFSDSLSRLGRARRSRRGDSILERWLSACERGAVAVVNFFWAILRRPFDAFDRWLGKRKASAIDRAMELEKLQFEQKRQAHDAQIAASLRRKAIVERQIKSLRSSWIAWLGSVAIAPFTGLWYFFSVFVRTRSRRIWWWGAPLIGVTALLIGSVLYLRLRDPNAIVGRYEAALVSSLNAGDMAQAEHLLRKLEQLGARTDRSEFRAAIELAKREEWELATERMSRLASVDRRGFPAAHLWLAQQLLDGRTGQSSAADFQAALLHLDHVQATLGQQAEISFLQGLAHYRLNQFAAAENSLASIEGDHPAAIALLMDMAQRGYGSVPAKDHARALYRVLQQRQADGETLTPDQLQWQVIATQILGDEETAAQATRDWYLANPEHPDARYQRTLALLRRVDRWLQAPNTPQVDAIVSDLQSAAELVPDEKYQVIIDRLSPIAWGRGQRPEFEAVYRGLVQSPDTPGSVLEHCGTVALFQQDAATADELLRRASERNPNWVPAWNNRAFLLSSVYPDRMTEALEYANKAVSLAPENPDARETRGTILFELKQFTKAIEDLELASNGSRDLKAIHEKLAASYRALGQEGMAKIYEERVGGR